MCELLERDFSRDMVNNKYTFFGIWLPRTFEHIQSRSVGVRHRNSYLVILSHFQLSSLCGIHAGRLEIISNTIPIITFISKSRKIPCFLVHEINSYELT